MPIFVNEAEMQAWLESELRESDGLADLIHNTEYLENFEPTSAEEKRIVESFNFTLSGLWINTVISSDKNISLKKDDSLRPDFILYSHESQGIVIVELKNIPGPTRQAGTELAGYATEVRTYIPFLSEGDIFNVIISNDWPTLLRHYIFHDIFWNQKNLLCLQPVVIDGKTRLEILSIDKLLEVSTAAQLAEEHIAGYQLCLYDKKAYTKEFNRNDLDKHRSQMEAALSIMAAEGNRQNSHGAALLWKDHWDLSLAPYSITMFNIAPFQLLERFLHQVDDLNDLNEFQVKLYKIMVEDDPSGQGDSLHRVTKSGFDILKQFCDPMYEGYHNWSALSSFLESRAELIAFRGWGLFEEQFNKRLTELYKSGDIERSHTCPFLGLKVIADIIDPTYQFIHVSNIDYFCSDEDENECAY